MNDDDDYDCVTATGACRVCSAMTTTLSGDCVPWRSFTDTNSVGGSKLSAITTLVACRAACVAERSCVAVDWDATGGVNAGCWLHDDSDNLLKQYAARGVTQYQLTRCRTTVATTTAAGMCPVRRKARFYKVALKMWIVASYGALGHVPPSTSS